MRYSALFDLLSTGILALLVLLVVYVNSSAAK